MKLTFQFSVDRVVAGVPARRFVKLGGARNFNQWQAETPATTQSGPKMICHSCQSQESVGSAGIAFDVLIPADLMFMRPTK